MSVLTLGLIYIVLQDSTLVENLTLYSVVVQSINRESESHWWNSWRGCSATQLECLVRSLSFIFFLPLAVVKIYSRIY